MDEYAGLESSTLGARPSLDSVLQRAEQCGVREGFESIRSHLLGQGFREFRRKNGLNFNLASRKQCLWVQPREAKIHLGYLDGNFAELFGVDRSLAAGDLGPNWLTLPPAEALQRIQQWSDIIARYRAGQSEEMLAETGSET